MHVRSAALALVIAAISFAACASSAQAQTSDPSVPGHGCCTLLPGGEPTVEISGFSFDTFLLDRASRLMTASSRWQSTALARPVTAARVRLTVARPLVSH